MGAFRIRQKRETIAFWTLQIVIWTLYYIYNLRITLEMYAGSHHYPAAIFYFYLFLYTYFGIPLSLGLKILYDRIAFTVRRRWTLTLIVAGAVTVAAHLWFLEMLLLDSLILKPDVPTTPYTFSYYLWEIFGGFLILLAWSGVYLFTRFEQHWKEQRHESERLRLLAENARLQMLRFQLNPHFLFNALSSVRALIRKDHEAAGEMLSKISEFLRYTLTVNQDLEVPLSEELRSIRNYIAIEKIRFREKLQVRLEIDPLAEDFPFPAFLLHPLMDNAIKHGMAAGPLPLEVILAARIEDHRLRVEVSNSTRWNASSTSAPGTGSGLRNVRDRLRSQYPGRSRFDILKKADRVRVVLEISGDVHDTDES